MRVLAAAFAFFWLQAEVYAAEPFVIGLSYPCTGSYKWEGLSQKRGALMDVKEIYRDGGVLGRPLKVISRSSGAASDRAAESVERLAGESAVMLMGERLAMGLSPPGSAPGNYACLSSCRPLMPIE